MEVGDRLKLEEFKNEDQFFWELPNSVSPPSCLAIVGTSEDIPENTFRYIEF